jgi:hypothetical protein
MIEINFQYLENNFETVMAEIEEGKKFVLKTPDGELIVLCSEKDESIKFAEQQQCISPYIIDNTN